MKLNFLKIVFLKAYVFVHHKAGIKLSFGTAKLKDT